MLGAFKRAKLLILLLVTLFSATLTWPALKTHRMAPELRYRGPFRLVHTVHQADTAGCPLLVLEGEGEASWVHMGSAANVHEGLLAGVTPNFTHRLHIHL